MSKERYNQIIDSVYQQYDELFDSYHPPFSAPYPTRLTKEELVEEIKKGGHDELGVTIEERELSFKERNEIYGVEKIQTNDSGWYEHSYAKLLVDKDNIPTKEITLTYNNETITVYE